MVQLVIRMSDCPGEWGLVELQGQLETRDQAPFDNMHLGDLHFDAQVNSSLENIARYRFGVQDHVVH